MGSKIFEFIEPVKEIETDILVAGAGPGRNLCSNSSRQKRCESIIS